VEGLLSIRRGPIPADSFTIISNAWLRDPTLSWKAKGLLSYIASHEPGHALSTDQIIGQATDGRDAVRAGLVELEQRGYLKRIKLRGDGGKINGTDYELTDPQTTSNGKPSAGKPVASRHQQEQRVSAGRDHSGLSGAGKPAGKKTSSLEDQKNTTTGASADAPAEVNTAKLLGDWIDWLKAKGIETLPGQTKARYGRELKQALADGFSVKVIGLALQTLYKRGKASNPQLLPHILIEVQATVPVSPAAPGQTFTQRDDLYKIAKERLNREKSDRIQTLIDNGVPTAEAFKAGAAWFNDQVSGLATSQSVETYAPLPYIEGDVVPVESQKEVTGS
jgi:hypothetical protein